MAKTTIQISEETKELLNEFRKKYNYTSYDNCVNSMSSFIIRNNINLKDDFLGDFKYQLISLEKRLVESFKETQLKITKDNTSLRNWVGGITKDHLVPLTKKLSVLDKITDYGIDKIKEDNFLKKQVENPLNKNIQSNLNVVQISQNEEQQESQRFKDLYSKYDAQKQALFKILNNAKIETGGMLSKEKIIVNLTLEEWAKIKNLGG